MPRFFFDYRQGDTYCRDTEGCSFATAEEAFLDAFEAAKDMWSELLGRREDPRRCSFEIRNEDGQVQYVLPFHEVLDSCRDVRRRAPGQIIFHEAGRNALRAQRLVGELQHELMAARTTLKRAKLLV